jgi:hypothetical protein
MPKFGGWHDVMDRLVTILPPTARRFFHLFPIKSRGGFKNCRPQMRYEPKKRVAIFWRVLGIF